MNTGMHISFLIIVFILFWYIYSGVEFCWVIWQFCFQLFEKLRIILKPAVTASDSSFSAMDLAMRLTSLYSPILFLYFLPVIVERCGSPILTSVYKLPSSLSSHKRPCVTDADVHVGWPKDVFDRGQVVLCYCCLVAKQ